MIEPIKEN
jgi:hypothetical protein